MEQTDSHLDENLEIGGDDTVLGDGGIAEAMAELAFEQIVRIRLRPVVETLDESSDNRALYREIIAQVERAMISLALDRTGGNQQRAAKLLGISRNTLRTKQNGTQVAAGSRRDDAL